MSWETILSYAMIAVFSLIIPLGITALIYFLCKRKLSKKTSMIISVISGIILLLIFNLFILLILAKH